VKLRIGLDSIPDDLRRILGPNEQVQMFIQQKFYGPKVNIDSVAITNERVILRHPHALRLRQDYTDYNYQDIANVLLDKGILRSTLRCTLRFGGDALALNDLPTSEAEKAYGIIRENLVRYQSPMTAGRAGIPPFQQQPVSQTSVSSCAKCGAPLAVGQKFCGNCGAAV
jgi:hypothetical protein